MGAKNKSNEIKLTRIYEAPVQAVWDAWTDPKQVAQWWGPRGFTLTTSSKDLRPGGSWIYMMHGPDGTDYPNKTLYHEVVEFKKLVYDHGANDDHPALFRVTVLFSEVEGGTKMEMTMTLPTPEAAEETRKFIKQAGGNSTWDRLAEYLKKEDSGKEEFVITRSFEAPLSVLVKMWMEPQHFSKWLPPGEMEEGSLKVQAPGRMSYLHSSDNPSSIRTYVQLVSEGSEQTRVRVSRELDKALAGKRGEMTQGWTVSFDRLEKLL